MSKHLPVPPELQHLIEKREADRRKKKDAEGATPPPGERRKKTDRRLSRRKGN